MITINDAKEIVSNQGYLSAKPFSNKTTFKYLHFERKNEPEIVICFSREMVYFQELSDKLNTQQDVFVKFRSHLFIETLSATHCEMIFFDVETYTFSETIKLYIVGEFDE